MLDNADAQREFANRAESKNLSGSYKMYRDCEWAFRFVAEMAEQAERASIPPKEQTPMTTKSQNVTRGISDDDLSIEAHMQDLVRLHGEQHGGTEDFYLVDQSTIGCRYADCCISFTPEGWVYGGNRKAYSTPIEAYENRSKDYNHNTRSS